MSVLLFQYDDGLCLTCFSKTTTKNRAISSLCGLSCHDIGYVFIARVWSNVNSICFTGCTLVAFSMAYDFVNKDKQQFRQRSIFFCPTELRRISAWKNERFFVEKISTQKKKDARCKGINGYFLRFFFFLWKKPLLLWNQLTTNFFLGKK